MRQSLAEVLRTAAEMKDDLDKVTVLTMNDSPQLRKIIKYVLDPKVQWWEFLKGSKAPYKPNRYMDAEGRLFGEIRILYMFVESGDDWNDMTNDKRLTRMALQSNERKRQRIWLQLLESITPDDAELLCAAPFHKFPFEGLSEAIIEEAFPGLIAAGHEPPQQPVRPQTITELTTEEILK